MIKEILDDGNNITINQKLEVIKAERIKENTYFARELIEIAIQIYKLNREVENINKTLKLVLNELSRIGTGTGAKGVKK